MIMFLGIPALQPIIHDLFVLRAAGKSDIGEDIETQREVVVSMLLRLVQHPEVGLSSDWLADRQTDRQTARETQTVNLVQLVSWVANKEI